MGQETILRVMIPAKSKGVEGKRSFPSQVSNRSETEITEGFGSEQSADKPFTCIFLKPYIVPTKAQWNANAIFYEIWAVIRRNMYGSCGVTGKLLCRSNIKTPQKPHLLEIRRKTR